MPFSILVIPRLFVVFLLVSFCTKRFDVLLYCGALFVCVLLVFTCFYLFLLICILS